jgi:hypothetical protein
MRLWACCRAACLPPQLRATLMPLKLLLRPLALQPPVLLLLLLLLLRLRQPLLVLLLWPQLQAAGRLPPMPAAAMKAAPRLRSAHGAVAVAVAQAAAGSNSA